jgi:hypothetical protein
MRRIASHILTFTAALTLLLTVVLLPCPVPAFAGGQVAAVAEHTASVRADDQDDRIAVTVQEHSLDEEHTECGEGEEEARRTPWSHPLPSRHLRQNRARGPPAVARWFSFQLTLAPRGPPLA